MYYDSSAVYTVVPVENRPDEAKRNGYSIVAYYAVGLKKSRTYK